MSSEYYVIKKEAVPEVLRKVVEVNRLLAGDDRLTIAQAARQAGISRSSYYKFRNDVEEFHDSRVGTTLNLSMDITDETGVLSNLLGIIAEFGANILTIHQSVPMNGVATVSISIQLLKSADNITQLMSGLEKLRGVRQIRITGRQGI